MVDELYLLVFLWMFNGLLALAAVLYYLIQRQQAKSLCVEAKAAKDHGALRILERRIFRYTSRMVAKFMLMAYAFVRADIVIQYAPFAIRDSQWVDAILFTGAILWLTWDTIRARDYD